MDHQNQKPIIPLIIMKMVLLTAFLVMTLSARHDSNRTVTIGNPPFTECERADIVAKHQNPAWLTEKVL